MMPDFMRDLLGWLSVPEQGLTALAVIAFLSATLLPGVSEVVLAGVLKSQPDDAVLAVGIATAANVAGSLVTYGLGRLGRHLPNPKSLARWQPRVERFGPPFLIFTWVPGFGDVLALVAGYVRLSPWKSAVWITLGKGLRYVAVWQGVGWLA